jgi:hypothetical protein
MVVVDTPENYFSELSAALPSELRADSAVLDGEIVCL